MIDKKLSLTSIRLQALQKIESATDNMQFNSNPSLDSVSDEASTVSHLIDSVEYPYELLTYYFFYSLGTASS